MTNKKHCGYVAIVGRPSVGKSTLLNKIVGQKISITARKPQTTRHKILGIKSNENTQAIYVDTPGFYNEQKKALNSYMLKVIDTVLRDVDVVVFVVEAAKWRDDDELILQKLNNISSPVILVINKVDSLKEKKRLLPQIEVLAKKRQFAGVIPLSAKQGTGISELEAVIAKLLPESPFFYYAEQVTDRSQRFLVAEIIREKLTRMLGHELPHELTVAVEKFADEGKIIHISAVIYVEKQGQKIIIIGKKGEKMKEIGKKARLDIQKMVEKKVFLQLWVKVKSGWTNDEKVLASFGYNNQD